MAPFSGVAWIDVFFTKSNSQQSNLFLSLTHHEYYQNNSEGFKKKKKSTGILCVAFQTCMNLYVLKLCCKKKEKEKKKSLLCVSCHELQDCRCSIASNNMFLYLVTSLSSDTRLNLHIKHFGSCPSKLLPDQLASMQMTASCDNL